MTSTLREVGVFIGCKSTEFMDDLHFVLVFDYKNMRCALLDCKAALVGMRLA
jgi:hypothetical protein